MSTEHGVTLTFFAQINDNEPHPITSVTIHGRREASRRMANTLRSIANVVDAQGAFEDMVATYLDEDDARD